MSSTNSAEILQTLSTAIQDIAEGASPSVVSVGSDGRNGSGIVWDDKGHVVTAHHVVRGLTRVDVGSEGGDVFQATVVGHDRRSDLALLRAEPKLLPIKRGDSESLNAGQFVLALANPYAARASVTSGIITGVKRNIGGWWGFEVRDAIITDARVNPGYSGGPLVDASGRMIGMNVASISSRGIAIPVATIAKLAEKLASGGKIGRAYLGIVSNPVQVPDGQQRSGLMIVSVERDSPADRAGLFMGDVLLGFGGKTVEGFGDLTDLLTEDAVGKPAKVRVLRAGKMEEKEVIPGEAPEAE